MNESNKSDMTVIEKDGYEFLIDIEKTKEYYEQIDLCECAGCRNYYIQAKKQLPKTAAFLSEFGIDVERPDHISWNPADGKMEYLPVNYTACGKMTPSNGYCVEIKDGKGIKIKIYNSDSGDYFPTSQKGEFICFSIWNVRFPWKLDEPFDEMLPENLKASNKENLWNKIKKLLKL